MLIRMLSVLVFALALASCSREETETTANRDKRGPEKVEERPLAAFSAILVPGKVQLKVKKGATKMARLSGPSNYLEDLAVHVEEREVDGEKRAVLVIDLQQKVLWPMPIVEVSTPEISHVSASGVAQVQLEDFSRAHLKIIARDASKVTLAPGAYEELHAEAHMAGRILAPDVMVETAHLSAVAGPAVVKVGQVGRVSRSSSAGGKVIFSGRPEFLP